MPSTRFPWFFPFAIALLAAPWARAAEEPPPAGQTTDRVAAASGAAVADAEVTLPPAVVDVRPAPEAELVENSVILTDTEVRSPNALQRIWQWSDSRFRGFFETVLPDTQDRRTWRWSLQPRLGDVVRHEHIRFPMKVTYGFNRRLEGNFGLDPYLPNPFEHGHGTGAANISGGLKYQWSPWFDAATRAATGIQVTHPLSSAPFEFNDGMNRYSLLTTFARPSPWMENLEHFFNISYDVLTPTAASGEIDEDEPQDDFVQVGTGVLWRRQRFIYGLAISYAHTVDGPPVDYTTLTPSVSYDVPSKWVFNSPGQWQIGAAVEAKRYGDQTDLDFKLRVRWDVDFRKMVRDWREARTKSRYTARND